MRLEPRKTTDAVELLTQTRSVLRAKTLFEPFDEERPDCTGYRFAKTPQANVFLVKAPSQLPGSYYTVDLNENTCDCPQYIGVMDHKTGRWISRPKNECKHVIGLYMHLSDKSGEIGEE